jgi:hypothetical protein
VTGLVLAVALALAPVPAEVQEPAPMAAEGTEDPALAEAKRLYDEGLADYETFEYEGAIEKWTLAFGKLGAAANTAEMRNAIVYNIARAREKAYEQSGDIGHLRKAKALLERYVAEEMATASFDPDDIAIARARVDELGRRIDELERKAKPAAPAPAPKPTDDRDEPRPGRAFVIAGGTLVGVGLGLVVGGVTAGAVLGQQAADDVAELDALGDEAARKERIADGKSANILLIASAAAGGAAALTGAALLSVGAAKRRKASRTAWAPSFSRSFAGLSVQGRF